MIEIVNATSDETKYVERMLDQYNANTKPLTQEKDGVYFNYSAVENGKIVGGVLAYSSYYKIGYIDTLWVDSGSRRKGIGTLLITQVEKSLRKFGCQIVHLETFDFQGPEFYRANNYVEFGKLEYPNANLKEFYFKKNL